MQNQVSFTINSSDAFATTKEYNTPRAPYQLLSGDGALRSVVIDPETKKILCVAPPKSLTEDEFTKQGQPTVSPCDPLPLPGTYGAGGSQGGQPSPCFANEIIEGTMVNLFYDPRIAQWEIATKGAVGGDYWYFRTSYDGVSPQTTFRDMFLDALASPRDMELNNVPLIASLDETISYSFVLQHPMNHIVLPVEVPRLFLVAMYRVLADNTTVRTVPIWVMRDGACPDNHLISYPVEYEVASLDDMPSAVGVMFHDKATGFRLSKKNAEYERKRDIRGNHPNIQFQYLELNAENNVPLFLHEFPQYTPLFSWFYHQTQDYITQLHSAYIAYFIHKRGKEIQIPKLIFVQIHNLHKNIYRANGGKKLVNRRAIEEYVAGMTVSEQLFHTNGGGNLRSQ